MNKRTTSAPDLLSEGGQDEPRRSLEDYIR
jgi:hypothetical protein